MYQCRCDDGRVFALKVYPDAASPDRLAEVHRVWRFAIAGGCRWLPPIDAVFSVSGRTWEASTWIDGTPAKADADVDVIGDGARAIGDFHRSVADLGTHSMPAPAVATRLQRLKQLDAIVPAALSKSPPTGPGPIAAAIRPASDLLALNWSGVSRRLTRGLLQYAHANVTCHYILRDVHRQNVLFRGSETAAIIDLDAVRIDTPIADLARWVGDFLVDRPNETPAIWQAALAGIDEKNVFRRSGGDQSSDLVLKFAQTLHASTTWISLANWLNWIQLERRPFDVADEVVAERILRLTRSAVAENFDRTPTDASSIGSLTWDSSQN